MTTLRRIIAVVLAVMLIASIGVIGASAAGEKLTIDATGTDAKGFKFDIYQIATLDFTTGEYTCINNDVAAVVNKNNQSGAEFLADVKTLFDQDKIGEGAKVKNDLKEAKYTTDVAGIYFVKVDGNPQIDGKTVAPTKKNDTIAVWPQAVNGTYTKTNVTVNLSEKVSSSPVTVDKKFAVSDADSKSLGQSNGTKDVDFLLSATIAGSTDKKATEYYIWDKMSKGLTYNKNTVKVYSDADLTQDISNGFTVSDGDTINEEGAYNGGTYFTVEANADTLAGNAFYGYGTIYVKYTATLNANAKVAPLDNPNKDGLYAVVDGQPIEKDGNVRKVYTYNLKIKKVDGTNNKGLNGAEFDLKMSLNGGAPTTIASGTSANVNGEDGIVEFKVGGKPIKLAPSVANKVEYTVVETKAVSGYAKNTDVIPVTVSDTKNSTAEYDNLTVVPVPNFPTKIPPTGGAGTLMFTIGGIALILAAGVMFVIIMKKRSSSK